MSKRRCLWLVLLLLISAVGPSLAQEGSAEGFESSPTAASWISWDTPFAVDGICIAQGERMQRRVYLLANGDDHVLEIRSIGTKDAEVVQVYSSPRLAGVRKSAGWVEYTPRPAVVIDLDGDGEDELVFASSTESGFLVLRREGDSLVLAGRVFCDGRQGALLAIPPQGSKLGQLVSATWGSPSAVRIFSGHATEGLQQSGEVLLVGYGRPRCGGVFDVDSDGLEDLVFFGTSDGKPVIVKQVRKGEYVLGQLEDPPTLGKLIMSCQTEDIDGDGRLELFVQSLDVATIAVFRSGSFEEYEAPSIVGCFIGRGLGYSSPTVVNALPSMGAYEIATPLVARDRIGIVTVSPDSLKVQCTEVESVCPLPYAMAGIHVGGSERIDLLVAGARESRVALLMR